MGFDVCVDGDEGVGERRKVERVGSVWVKGRVGGCFGVEVFLFVVCDVFGVIVMG